MQYDQFYKTKLNSLIAPKPSLRKILGSTFGKDPQKKFLQLALIFPAMVFSQAGYSESRK